MEKYELPGEPLGIFNDAMPTAEVLDRMLQMLEPNSFTAMEAAYLLFLSAFGECRLVIGANNPAKVEAFDKALRTLVKKIEDMLDELQNPESKLAVLYQTAVASRQKAKEAEAAEAEANSAPSEVLFEALDAAGVKVIQI